MWPWVSNITFLSLAVLIIKMRLMVVPTSQKCLEDRLRSYIKHQHSIWVQCRRLGVQPRNHRQIHTGDGGLNFPVVSSFFFLAFQHPFPTSLVTISHFSFQFKKLSLHTLSPCDSSVAVSTTIPTSVSGTRVQPIRGCECLLQDLYWNRRREKHLFFPGLLLCQDAQWELLVSHLWSSLPRMVSIERKTDPRGIQKTPIRCLDPAIPEAGPAFRLFCLWRQYVPFFFFLLKSAWVGSLLFTLVLFRTKTQG